jgi:hypothetical protein
LSYLIFTDLIKSRADSLKKKESGGGITAPSSHQFQKEGDIRWGFL